MKQTNSSRTSRLMLRRQHHTDSSGEVDHVEEGGSPCNLVARSSSLSPRRNSERSNKMQQPRFYQSLGAATLVIATIGLGLFLSYSQSSLSSSHEAMVRLGIVDAPSTSRTRRKQTPPNPRRQPATASDESQRISTSKLHHGTTSDGVEYYWQLPLTDSNDNNNQNEVKAIFFVAHGCKHSATDWFPPDDKDCPHCLGLPEEVAIVQMARERGMLVVAASSKERTNKCWLSGDGKRVARVLDTVQKAAQVTLSVPVIGFGSSSGAEMVGSFLVKATNVSGVISQNKVPNDQRWTNANVPAVFISMPHSGDTKTRIRDYVQKHRKGPTKTMDLPPVFVDGSFFHQRIPDKISQADSEAMHQIMQELGMLEEQQSSGRGSRLKQDPRETRRAWSQPFRSIVGQNDTLIPDESGVFEVLNVAYGHHQTTRDGVAEALDWLMLTLNQQKQGHKSGMSN